MNTVTFTLSQMFWGIIGAAGIPGLIAGFVVWLMQRKILTRDKQREEENLRYRKEREQKEADRERLELFLVESVNATVALSVATAKAVQRIPDAHCNGDMHKALEVAETAQRNQESFLRQRGLQAII